MMAILLTIGKISRTDEDGLNVEITFEEDGVVFEGNHYLTHDDQFGFSPDIRAWIDKNNPEILPYIPPEPEPAPPIVIPAVTFWERTTEAEGTAIEAMLNQQPFRVRQIFMTAQSYRSDHELWPLLSTAATQLFGEPRATELLAQPSNLAA